MTTDRSLWHKISNIDRQIKQSQDGNCSICGPVGVGYDSYNNQFYCREKASKALAKRKADNPDFNKYIQKQKQNHRWMYVYKLDQDQVISMFQDQNGQCCICFSSISLETSAQNAAHIDHDHNCCSNNASSSSPLCGNCNRGLLCSRCNLAIGNFNDDIDLMKSAIVYLEKYIS
jgi:hypothetical protein